MALQQPRSDGCNFWKQSLVTVSLTKRCSGRSVGAAVLCMTDSLWGSPQMRVAEILGRLEKKAGLLGEWLLVGLMNI